MRRKLRRVVVLTPTECETAGYACGYVAEFSGMDGDIDEATGARARKAREAIHRGSSRCLDVDVDALDVGIQAIQLQCSCDPWVGRHASDCYVTMHRVALDRLLSLRKLLTEAP